MAMYLYRSISGNVAVLLITTGLSLATQLANKYLINALEISGKTGEIGAIFTGCVILYLFFYFMEKTGGFLSAFGQNFFRFNVEEHFLKLFMWKSNQTPQSEFFKSEFMEKYSFISRNIYHIGSYIGSLTQLIFSNIAVIAGTVGLFLAYEPMFILYAGFIAAVTVVLNRYITKMQYELDRKQIHELRKEEYYNGLLTGKESAKELRIFRFHDWVYKKWTDVFQNVRKERYEVQVLETKMWGRQARILLYLRIPAIGFLIYGVIQGKYDAGTFVLLFGLIQLCEDQINCLTYNMMSGVYKDTKYLIDYYDFVFPVSHQDINNLCKKSSEPWEPPYGKFQVLELSHVSYQYPNGERNAVNDVSLTVRRGEIISILGYNGSGKTTLSKLINGSLKPVRGSVKLNGVEITEENRGRFYRYYGNSPQEYSKFSIPIRDMVGIGDIDYMEEDSRLHSAYQKGGLNSIIGQYSMGDKTLLGKEYSEQGVELSGGEWQKLVIASAYMGEPEILLMDEPSASIDPIREMEMINQMRQNLSDKTAVLISHRIAFARLADRIIMMKDGTIAEQGTHEQLLANQGYYAEIFEKQKELYL